MRINRLLADFVCSLPTQLRVELMHGIVIYLDAWIRWDDPALEVEAMALLMPARWERRDKNAVLIAGLFDHFFATLPARTLEETLFDVRSIDRKQWEAARVRWLALRAGELSPAKIDDLDGYSSEES